MRKQINYTPEQGKQLIAEKLVAREDFQKALKEHTVVIIAGTTNGFVAREALKSIGVTDFDASGFMRGVMRPAKANAQATPFPGDVVITRGQWRKGLTIFDVAKELQKGDIICKGANAVHLATRTAGVLIGNDTCGTILPALEAAIGRRAKLIVPVGVEKRVEQPIYELARLMNDADTQGPRLFPLYGEIFTELDALQELDPVLVACGGIDGYEGICRYLVNA